MPAGGGAEGTVVNGCNSVGACNPLNACNSGDACNWACGATEPASAFSKALKSGASGVDEFADAAGSFWSSWIKEETSRGFDVSGAAFSSINFQNSGIKDP